jgi:zinc protease
MIVRCAGLLVCLAAIAVPVCGAVQSASVRSAPVQSGPMQSGSMQSASVQRADVPPAPPGLQSFERVDLPNGLKVLMGTPVRPALFSEVLLVVRAGTGVEAGSQEEIARTAAEALAAGRRSPDVPSVREELARLGVTLDFTVGREVAVFRFAVPTAYTQRFLPLLADLLDRRGPSAAEVWDEAIARRSASLAREQQDGWQRATTQLTSLLWKLGKDDPAPRLVAQQPRATMVAARAVDREAVATFWRRAYTATRMVLSVWGEVPIAELTPSVRREFGRLAAGDGSGSAPPLPVRLKGGGVYCVEQEGAVPAALLVGVGADIESDRAFYAWQVAAHILGASYNSRLQHRLRTESQVVYTVEASCMPVGPRGMTLRVACQTDQVESTRRIILEEMRRLAAEPVTAEELDLARALLRSRLKLDEASFRDQFYRRSLAWLSRDGVREASGAEPVLAALTPKTLFEVLRATLKPDEAATVVVSVRPESFCEGSHDTKP